MGVDGQVVAVGRIDWHKCLDQSTTSGRFPAASVSVKPNTISGNAPWCHSAENADSPVLSKWYEKSPVSHSDETPQLET